MKTLEEYQAEYLKTVIHGVRDNLNIKNPMIVKENIWICCKWQEDNKWNPWDKDAREKLEELAERDEELFEVVASGLEEMQKNI